MTKPPFIDTPSLRSGTDFRRSFLSILAGAVVLVSVSAASADWLLIDDFESGHSFSGSLSTTTDPADGGNNVLNFDVANGASSVMSLSAAQQVNDGQVGTVFYQVYIPAAGRDVGFGLSDIDLDPNWGDYAGYVMQLGDPLRFDGKDGNGAGSATNVVLLNPVTTAAWYDFWLVFDLDGTTGAETGYDIYASGPGLSGQQNLASGLGFRRTANPDALDRIMLREGGSGSGNVLFDNIYMDQQGQNLANPIPEPATLALAAVGLGGLRRRKRA